MKYFIAALGMLAFIAPVFAEPRDGQGIDRNGAPVIDPTENVKALNEAAQKRQDDLRSAGDLINELRFKHLTEMASLRADYEDKLRKAEAGRLDAIRLVDTTNLAVDRERAAATAAALQKKGDDSALVLSAQLTKSADDVRTLVKTTADEQSRNLTQQFTAIQTQFTSFGSRLTALEQAGAEGIGKQKFQDPAQSAAIAQLTAEVQRLAASRDTISGQGAGRGDVIGWVIAGITLLLLMISVGFVVVRGGTKR